MDIAVRRSSSSSKTEIRPLSNSTRSCSKSQIQDEKLGLDFTNYVEAKEDHQFISPFRCSLSQFIAAIVTSLLAISYGFTIGFTTIITYEIKNDTKIANVTEEQITWIGSMNYFSTPVGALLGGPLAQWLGRRNALLSMTIPYALAWLLISYSKSVNAVLLAFVILGVVGGLVDPSLQVYVTEISEPRLRGAISCFVTSCIMLGIFVQLILSTQLNWRTIALVNVAAPGLALLLIGRVPESPHWLASRARLNDAERALCWLRGWTRPNHVAAELNRLIESTKTESKLPSSTTSLSNQALLLRLARQAVMIPFCLVNFAFFVSCFNGSTSILTYAMDIFEKLNSPLNVHDATIVLTALQLLASLLLPFLVPRTGKRKPTFLSLVITGIAYLVVAAYVFLGEIFKIGESSWMHWIPLLAIEISVFATTLGIETTPWILVGEVFPGDVRDWATGAVTATGFVYAALASKSFHAMLDVFSLGGTFLFFANVNLIGLIVLYRFMPETEGRSLEEIEAHFAGKRSLDEPVPGPEGTELLPISHGTQVRVNGNGSLKMLEC